jgi:hypothetical protein
MSAKVTIVTRDRVYQLKRALAARKVRRESLSFRWLDNFTVVEIEPGPVSPAKILFWDGLLGTGNLLPFAKLQNPLCAPPSTSYPIPAVGAHNRPLWCHASILYAEAQRENRQFEASA